MDAHKVLKEVFYQLGINDISIYSNYIYAFIAFISLLSYIFSFKKQEYSLINVSALKKKVKDLEALTSQLSATIEKLEEKQEINEKQNSFRLDMQSAEQKDIRMLMGKLTNSMEHIVQNFYESDE